MHSLELPLDLVLNIIELAVLSGEIVVILRLRQVNRLFDREITKHLANFRLRDVKLHSSLKERIIKMPMSFKLRLVVYCVGSQYRGQNEIKTLIHAVTDDLESRMAELKSPTKRPEILESICKVALTHRGFGDLCQDLLEDGESRSQRSPGEDESQDVPHSSLIVAVASRYNEVQSAMLQSGMNPDFENRHFGIPLQTAIAFGHCDTVKILLDRGAAIDQVRHRDLSSALEEAVFRKHTAIVHLLLDPKYGMKTYGALYGQAAYWAVHRKDFDIATIILERSTKIPMSARHGICYQAARHGYDKLVIKMLDSGVDVNKVNCEASTPLAEAAEGGHYSTVRLLLDRGANVRNFCKDAFVEAAGAGRLEILEMMLQRGIDTKADSRMCWAFESAVVSGIFESVQFLLDNGLDIRSAEIMNWRYHILWEAIINNRQRENVDTIRWLILNLELSPDGDKGVPGAAFTIATPMKWALERGRPEIVKLLFQLGAKLIDQTDVELTYSIPFPHITVRQQDALNEYRRWEEAKLS